MVILRLFHGYYTNGENQSRWENIRSDPGAIKLFSAQSQRNPLMRKLYSNGSKKLK